MDEKPATEGEKTARKVEKTGIAVAFGGRAATVRAMGSAALPRITPEEYLSFEREAPTRSEYHDGAIVALAGGSWEHNSVVDNLSSAINARVLARSCRSVTSDQKVWIPRTRRFLYPDVLGVCGPPRFHGDQRDAVLNPVVIFEVLSKSTEGYDRGEKFSHYRTIESLLEYVLVAQDAVQIETFLRQDSGFWRYSALEPDASGLPLRSLEIDLPISEVYRGLPFLGV